MRPLKERSGLMSPVERDALELLRAAGPFRPSDGSKQRVRAKLLERRVARGGRMVRPAVVIAALSCAAVASAALGAPWLSRIYHRWTGHPGSEGAASISPSAAAPAVAESAAAESAIADEIIGNSKIADSKIDGRSSAASDSASSLGAGGFAPHAIGAGQPGSVERSAEARAGRGSSPRPRADRGTPPLDESTLVFDAMRALRQEKRPLRASKLLAEYERRFPDGALAEEALALSIEAATMQGDPRARAMADLYLNRYPGGRFRPAAERARARFAP